MRPCAFVDSLFMTCYLSELSVNADVMSRKAIP